ncbi:MAG: transcriptional regulator [Kutzneria sp.]|nr:transcriptional regulator [Kutzneria sp.]
MSSPSQDHPTRGLDDVVHQRTRLGILTVLVEAKSADFTTLADILGLTAGNLSRNLSVLADHGYVRIEKTFDKRRPRTWISVTPEGVRILREEVAMLREVVTRVDRATANQASVASRPRLGNA